MRADRLVAILLMLQRRGHVTAAEVANELEISERTARRDLDALGTAGLPIYSRQGRGGGWQLIGGARTDLSGLTGPEARALFLVAGPSSTATPEVKAALRKLVRALPEPFRLEAEAASMAVISDPTGWGSTTPSRPPPPFLDELQSAVIEAEQVELGYTDRERNPSRRVVHPLGLASKGLTWYLVADTANGLRTFRVDRITSVERTGDAVVRPPGFVLAEAWAMIADEVQQRQTSVWGRGTIAAESVSLLRMMFGNRVRIGTPTTDGRVEVEIGSAHLRALAGELAGLGAMLEIEEPPELRDLLADIGRQLADLYAGTNNDPSADSPPVMSDRTSSSSRLR
jgi:predicted DNA-binding transcriptional regulator YafY